MLGVYLNCLLEFLTKKGVQSVHIDNHTIGSVTYYFDHNITEIFDGDSCVSLERAKRFLNKYSIEYKIQDFKTDECACVIIHNKLKSYELI